LAAALGDQLERAAHAVRAHAEAERQMGGALAALAKRRRRLRFVLLLAAVPLIGLSLSAAAYGWWARGEDSTWYAWIVGGLTGAASAFVLAIAGAVVAPAASGRLMRRWAAVPLPGGQGLACRVCGGPLPGLVQAVLRCGYCGADNLADATVLARVRAGAARAVHELLSVNERRRAGEDVLALALVAYPALCLLAWFATGAAAGSALIAIGHEIELGADSDARFVLVRYDTGSRVQACLADMGETDGALRLSLGDGVNRSLSREALARYQVAPPIAPDALVGRNIESGGSSGRVARLWRALPTPEFHVARLDSGTDVYLPRRAPGASKACLPDVSPGSGESLK